MFYRLRVRYLWGLITVVLVLLLAAGCSAPPGKVKNTPEPPSSLTIDNNEDDDQQVDEDQSDASESVDSFIKTTLLRQAEDGSAVIQVETKTSLDPGTYQARYFDSDGGENTAPCEPVEGSDNELQCSVVLAGGFQQIEFQLYYLEPIIPFITAGEEYDGINLMNLIEELEGNILPPEFHPENLESIPDVNLFIHHICTDWKNNDEMPDILDPICEEYFSPSPLIPNDHWPPSGPCWPGDDCYPGGSDSHASTMPDPDCEGDDAGSFWCQETEEQKYLAGRLAVTCLDQINAGFEDPLTAFEDPLTAFEDPLTAFEDPLTAFEDPLTAFEDPLTAFEDPLTAFEDPLTAFEDPLTAFEDPLTAMDVARITILYRVLYPSIPNSAALPACNQLARLGDHSQYLRTGETLLEYLAGYFPSFKPLSGRLPLDTSELSVMPAHCGYFEHMNFESRVQLNVKYHTGFIDFDAAEPLPGMHYFVFGDPTPYYYSATLGGNELNTCSFAGETGLRCDWDSLPESLYGQEQEYALYVTGCDEPLHTGVVTLPAYDYSRCTVFEEMAMSLDVANPSTDLSIYVTMPNGVPGLEVADYPGFDNLPVYYYSRFCGEQTFCEIYDWLPGLLYCNFEVSADCLTNYNEFDLLVDQCGVILTRTLQVIVPTHGGGVGDEPGSGDGGGGSSGSSCTWSTKWACEGNGGTWSGASDTVGICTCP